MDFYWLIFSVLLAVVGLLLLTQASEGSVVPASGPNVAAYKRHMVLYVLVYSLMMRECLVG